MGRVVNRDGFIFRLWNIWFNLRREFFGERIVLGYGDYLIKINTWGGGPDKVWLHMTSSVPPVCQGDTSYVAAKAVHDGFILKATIRTDECTIDWFIE